MATVPSNDKKQVTPSDNLSALHSVLVNKGFYEADLGDFVNKFKEAGDRAYLHKFLVNRNIEGIPNDLSSFEKDFFGIQKKKLASKPKSGDTISSLDSVGKGFKLADTDVFDLPEKEPQKGVSRVETFFMEKPEYKQEEDVNIIYDVKTQLPIETTLPISVIEKERRAKQKVQMDADRDSAKKYKEYQDREKVSSALDAVVDNINMMPIVGGGKMKGGAFTSGVVDIAASATAITAGAVDFFNKYWDLGEQDTATANLSDNLFEISNTMSQFSASFSKKAERDFGVKEENLDKSIVKLINEGELSDAFAKIGVGVIKNIPQMTLIAASSGSFGGVLQRSIASTGMRGAALAEKIGAMRLGTFGTSAAYGTGLELAGRYTKEEGIDATDYLSSVFKGVITGLTESVFMTDVVAARQLGKKIFTLSGTPEQQAIRTAVLNRGRDAVKEDMIRSWKQVLYKGLGGANEEGFEEILDTVGGFMVDTIETGEWNENSFEKMLEQATDSYLIGAASGGVLSGALAAVSRKPLTDAQKQKIEVYQKIIEDKNVSRDAKEVAKKKIDEIVKQNNEDLKDDYLSYSELPLEKRKQVFDILTKIRNLDNDKTTVRDAEVKQDIENDIAQKYSEIADILKEEGISAQPIPEGGIQPTEQEIQEEPVVEEPIVEEVPVEEPTPAEAPIVEEEPVAPEVQETIVPEQATTEEVVPPTEEQPEQAPIKEKKPDEIKNPFATVSRGMNLKRRVIGIVNTALEKGESKKDALEKGLANMRISKAYAEATDVARESMEREIRKEFKVREIGGSKATMGKTGITPKTETELVDIVKALKDQIKLEVRASKEGAQAYRDAVNSVVEAIKSFGSTGKLSPSKQAALINIFGNNLLNENIKDRQIARALRIIQDGQYNQKLEEANKLREQVKKISKSKTAQATTVQAASNFSQISPNKADNIDDYLSNAKAIINSQTRTRVKPSKEGGKEVVTAEAFNLDDVTSYIDSAIENERQLAEDRIEQKYYDAIESDIIDPDTTLDQFKEMLAEEKGNRDGYAESPMAQMKEETIQEQFDELSESARENLDEVENAVDRALVEDFLNMDLSMFTIEEQDAITIALRNFIKNGTIDSFGYYVASYNGRVNGEQFDNEGANAVRNKDGWWSTNLTQISTFLIDTFKSTNFANKFKKFSGLSELEKQANKAREEITALQKAYLDKFKNKNPNGKKFLDYFNQAEIGVYASLKRQPKNATKEQIKKEFERQKDLLRQTIDALKSKNVVFTQLNSYKINALSEIYDKIKDLESIEDVEKVVDPINKEAYDTMSEHWKQAYPKFKQVAAQYHNVILDDDVNYSPDLFEYTGGVQLENDNIYEQGDFFAISFDVIDTERAGNLRRNKKIDTLPENRVRDYNFSYGNFRALSKAFNDVSTIPFAIQTDSFLKSKGMKNVADSETLNTIKSKVSVNLNALRMSQKKAGMFNGEGSKYAKIPVQVVSYLSAMGSKILLASVSNIATQTIPIFLAASVNLGRNAGLLFSHKWFFNKSFDEALKRQGYSISRRGAESRTSIELAEKGFERDFGSPIVGGTVGAVSAISKFFSKVSEQAVRLFLVAGDVAAAKVTWQAYYKEYLKDNGLDYKNIDWDTHVFNEDAALYAETKVQQTQNVNISENAGLLFNSNTDLVKLVRVSVFPLASFTVNARDRMITNYNILLSEEANFQEKKDAAKNIVATVAETVSYAGLKFATAVGVKTLIAGALSILDGDDEKEAKKKLAEAKKESEALFRAEITAGAVFNDLILPTIPLFDELKLEAVNKILDYFAGDPDKIIKKEKEEERKLLEQGKFIARFIKKPEPKSNSLKKGSQFWVIQTGTSALDKYVDRIVERNEMTKRFPRFYVRQPEETRAGEALETFGGTPFIAASQLGQLSGVINNALNGGYSDDYNDYEYTEGERKLMVKAAAYRTGGLLVRELDIIGKDLEKKVNERAKLRKRSGISTQEANKIEQERIKKSLPPPPPEPPKPAPKKQETVEVKKTEPIKPVEVKTAGMGIKEIANSVINKAKEIYKSIEESQQVKDIKDVINNPDLVLARLQRGKDMVDETGKTSDKISIPETPIAEAKKEFSLTNGYPVVASDTTNLGNLRTSDSDYNSVSSIVDLNKVNVGSRNRGDKGDIMSDLVAQFLRPFNQGEQTETYFPNENAYVGIKDGKVVLGGKEDMKGASVNTNVPFTTAKFISGEYYNPEGAYQFPFIIDKDDQKSKQILNISLTAEGADDANNRFAGGAVIFETPDKKQKYLVRGSLKQVKEEFNKLKEGTKSDYLNLYILDNGSYSTGLFTDDGKSSEEEIKAYERKNRSGGHSIYINSYSL